MSITESEMSAIREMMREVFVDEFGKGLRGLEDRTGARFVALEAGLRSELGELRGQIGELRGEVGGLRGDVQTLSGRVDGLSADMVEVKAGLRTVVARLDVNEDDVRNARVRLALLAHAKEG